MKQTVVCLLLGALAVVASRDVPALDTVQRDEALGLECPSGWEMLYLDSDHVNPTCIFLDMVDDKGGYAQAKQRCEVLDSWLAEPEGWLHHEVYERIIELGLTDPAFWIGGSDQASEGTWIWERTGEPMPMGTPHWEHCEPSQPLLNDRDTNYACIWPKYYHYFSCRNEASIRTMCQKYPSPIS